MVVGLKVQENTNCANEQTVVVVVKAGFDLVLCEVRRLCEQLLLVDARLLNVA